MLPRDPGWLHLRRRLLRGRKAPLRGGCVMRGSKLRVLGVAALAALAVHAVQTGGGTGGGAQSAGANVALGRQMAAQRGWTGAQFTCLNELWTRESGWSNTAENRKSGAYGIAQALGHGPTNQYPAGPANPPTSDPRAQVEWGLGYIANTYGDPCAAWAHEESQGWY